MPPAPDVGSDIILLDSDGIHAIDAKRITIMSKDWELLKDIKKSYDYRYFFLRGFFLSF